MEIAEERGFPPELARFQLSVYSRPPSACAIFPGLPPTVNHAYRKRGQGHGMYMTSVARSWMEVAVAECRAAHPHWNPLTGPVWVLVVYCLKSRGNWDIDNRFKLLLDTLSAAGIWGDDRQVVNLQSHMLIQGNLPKPYTRVYVWELEQDELTAFAQSVRWAR